MRFLTIILLHTILLYSVGSATEHLNRTGIDKARKADHYLANLRFDSAEAYYIRALQVPDIGSDPDLYATTLNNYAETLWWQSRFYDAEIACRKNLETCISLFGYDHVITADAMVNLAALGFVSGRFAMITEYLYEAIAIYEQHLGPRHQKVAKAYEWLGTYYEGMADRDKGRKYLWKSFGIWKEIREEDHPDLGDIYRYMGLYHKRFYNHDSAVILFKKAKTVFDNAYGPANFQSVKCLNNLADIYMQYPELDHKVVPAFEKCFRLIGRFGSPMIMADVMTLFNYARYHSLKGNYIEALELLNQALAVYIPSFDPVDVFSNPDLDEVDYHQYLRIILGAKAGNFMSLYQEGSSETVRYLLAAIQCLELNDKLTEDHRGRFVNLDDFLKFEHGFTLFYHEMAGTCIEAFNKTGDTAYITKALNFLSKSSPAPVSNHVELALGDYFEIPANVLEKRREIQQEINRVRSRIMQASDEKKRKEFRRQLSRKNIELDRFYYQQLKSENLAYRVQTNPQIYISDLQRALGHGDCLLIYSEYIPLTDVLPTQLLAVAITYNTFKSVTLDGEDLFRQMNQLIAQVSQNPVNNTRDLTDELYRNLMMPFGEMFGLNIIIIPSPNLSRLAFDMLTIPSDRTENDKNYLIGHYSIRKEFSLNSFMQNHVTGSSPARPKVLAVAPKFNKSQVIQIAALTKRDTSLINLSGALVECEKITNYFDANLLTGFAATKQRFTGLSSNYNIIHLSTHGVPTKTDTLVMQLAFSAEGPEQDDHMMNLFEVFNLNLDADLVVLSACRTGYGKINHGLGSLSLNWAFSRAGARSSVISLWDVNDYASSVIMGAFYRNLSLGFTKPDALRFAKLEYIQTHDELMGDPYYWAGFVYYGPDHALMNRSTTYKGGIRMLLAGLLLLSGFLFLRKHMSF